MGGLDYEEILVAASPAPFQDNGRMAQWYAMVFRATLIITCLGIIIPILYGMSVMFGFLYYPDDYQIDLFLSINLTIIFVVSLIALFAHIYDNRDAYVPILAYLWFIKYGSTSTLAHHLALIFARNYYSYHGETEEQIQFELLMIYISIPTLLTTAFIHYLYYCSCESTSAYTCSRSNMMGGEYQLPNSVQFPRPLPAYRPSHYVSNNGYNLQSFPVIIKQNDFPTFGSGGYPFMGGPGYLKPCTCGVSAPRPPCLTSAPCTPQRISVLEGDNMGMGYWNSWYRHWCDWDFSFLETPQGIILIAVGIILILLIFCLAGGLVIACFRGRGSKKQDDVIVIDQQSSPTYQRGSDFGKY
ncbi:hypothetical protein FO519_007836 [Halicephalobus sp. NKZ332]|nr:hypothetical protein FO519_007836 [Halicephalobus sp. NKZ332]